MTKNSNFRLPDNVRAMLHTLAKIDNMSAAAVLRRLISREYMTRRDEIRAYRRDTDDGKD